MKKINFLKFSDSRTKRFKNFYKNYTQIHLNKKFYVLIILTIYFLALFTSVNFEMETLAKVTLLLFFPLFVLICDLVFPTAFNISNFQAPPQSIFLIMLCPILVIFAEIMNKALSDTHHNINNNIFKNEELLIFIHDLKNLLLPALGYAEINNIEKTRNKLYEICKKLNTINDLADKLPTDILIENVIKAKKPIIEHSKIDLNYKIRTTKEINIKDEDLSSLIGNIVDNAIEACNKIPKISERFINLDISEEKNTLIIAMENPRLADLNKENQYANPQKLLHGYGLKSVTQTAKKYGGKVECRPNGDLFFTEIIIPLS